ncbi:DUF2656 domain-containing protein [Gloeobacter kilaueensis]|uniref:DUF2656 domain-containing protein n=1 Tax=Gloeobacter kilaueensis (strain ATCC BAA-2537 / CCAP 1431/1 / ULC 316 / JS1) TaxID=1183438 RepID=U5QG46_GLOK1|nr:DUF2656 domain-containing protein [Gloeobacter kilaueensis]AGY57828.1 hypothetical protein GKIL_1582 [Gloeobacter kilaueensis JS1]
MLLSHSFDIPEEIVVRLRPEAIARIFIDSLSLFADIDCRFLENSPYWLLEILFPIAEISPEQIGQLCAKALVQRRTEQQAGGWLRSDVLVLGVLRTNPTRSSSPDALQPGNWGVDIVETASSEQFLKAIGWEAKIAQQPADAFFKLVVS